MQSEPEPIPAMPAEAAAVYERLKNDLIWLYSLRALMQQLYGTEERVHALNEAASVFFWRLQYLLDRETMLGISRLTDPARASGQRRLSLAALPEVLRPTTEPAFLAELHAKIDAAEAAAASIRIYRHKLLAHRDRDVALGKQAAAVTVERRQITQALSACAQALNLVERHYRNATVMYEQFVESLQDGPAILGAVRQAAVLKAMLEKGELDWERVLRHPRWRI